MKTDSGNVLTPHRGTQPVFQGLWYSHHIQVVDDGYQLQGH